MRNFVLMCLTLSRAIISDTKVRRQWLFFISLAIIIFVLGGYCLLREAMMKNSFLWLVYLLLSFVGLIFMFGFALLDFLLVRKSMREEGRHLTKDINKSR